MRGLKMATKCSFVKCKNPATHYDRIDKEYICNEHLAFLKGCGINIEYRKIEYPIVNSLPGKPWSQCSGTSCSHPSHNK